MDYKTLSSLKPGEFEDAADGYRDTSDMAGAARDRVEKQVGAKMREALVGKAPNKALGQLAELAKNFHYIETECGLISTALNALASDLRAAKKKLDGAVEDARAAHFTVEPDGSVRYPAGGDEVDGEEPEGGTVVGTTQEQTRTEYDQAARAAPNPNRARAQEFADRIAAAVQEATEADEKWAPKLRHLRADDDLEVSYADWADVQKDMGGVRKSAEEYLDGIKEPPGNGSPKENAAWWKGLSEDERADYVSLHPASVGKMDGIPADVRDDANRVVLAEKRGQYEMKLAAIGPEPWPKYVNGGGQVGMVQSDEWIAWHKKAKPYIDSIDGMKAIENRFASTGRNGLPPAYLMRFSPEGNGRAIVANGNPDTADHTAVYVPGTTSNLGKIDGDLERSNSLWRSTQSLDPDSKVSTITWLGYDAPQDIVKDSPQSHYADEGAPAFNRFMDGLAAANTTDSGGHHTAVGHSYGTTLIGSAARQGELNADDVVFAGSPGVQVGEASELDVPKGHVWNEEAEGDAVPDIGRYGHGGSQWNIGGGTQLIPSDDAFGARQMQTDTEGHSDYWSPGSRSLRNQAAVVIGEYGRVTIED
ncbi:alpha/beta hydrolase [Streptomyces daliensis]|uniref:DUF1023 domain-containing protein n=1 Tax=Streptomyces daliensis TaxID=299421 RepID=A0A8T4IJQ5_9ACTN|nr:hypothetical protein [Streptomyces daliensis]